MHTLDVVAVDNIVLEHCYFQHTDCTTVVHSGVVEGAVVLSRMAVVDCCSCSKIVADDRQDVPLDAAD